MPSFCVVSNCELKYSQSINVSFHKFPLSNPALLRQWVTFTDRGSDWTPSRWSSICSRHFSDTDFREYLSRKCLKKNAVPSIQAKSNISFETYHIQMNSMDNVNVSRSGAESIDDYDQTADKQSHREYCGLCGTLVDHLLYNAFGSLDDYDINMMYRKCLPNMRISSDVDGSRIICRDCITQLQQFSKFIDRIVAHHRNVDVPFDADDFHSINENQQKPIIISDMPLNIKQEPVNVKQENIDSSHKQPMVEMKKSFVTIPIERSSRSNAILSTAQMNSDDSQGHIEPRSTSNNCEIMEIITLNNPVSIIDLAEDENTSNMKMKVEASRAALDTSNGTEHIENDHSYARPTTNQLKQETIDLNAIDSAEQAELEGYDPNDDDVESYNTSETRLTCDKCDKSFDSDEMMNVHLAKSNCVTTKICPICSNAFESSYEYLKHKAKAHPTRLQCRKCMRKFRTQKLLEGHERFCRKTPKNFFFKCRHCKKRTVTITEMECHLQECNVRSAEQETKQVHENASNIGQDLQEQEAECSAEVDTEDIAHHGNNEPHAMDKSILPANASNTLKPLELRGTITSESSNRQNIKMIVDDSKFIFFNGTSELINTIVPHPSSAEEFGCALCGKLFSSLAVLNEHTQMHNDERKFSCSLCPKTFKGISGVKQHIRSFHYKIKPYTCDVCNYSYPLKGDMQRCRHSKLKRRLLEQHMTNV